MCVRTAINRGSRGSCNQGFEIRLHYALNPAEATVTVNLIHREAAFFPRFSESLERDIQPDLVPIFKQVREGFCDAVHFNWMALDRVNRNAFGKRFPTKPYDPERRIPQSRLAGPSVDREPDTGRELGADLVETQGGEEADDSTRYGPRHDAERVVFGDLPVDNVVLSPRDPFDRPLPHKPGENLDVPATSGGVE